MSEIIMRGFRTVEIPAVPKYEEAVIEASDVELPRVLRQEVARRKASRKLVFLTGLFLLLAVIELALFTLHPPTPRVVVYHMLPLGQEIQVIP